MSSDHHHVIFVDDWLARSAPDLPSEKLVELVAIALGVLTRRLQATLGPITVAAIVDRVMHNATERYPMFASVTLDAASSFNFDEMRARVRGSDNPLVAAELLEGTRYLLVEYLTVVGNLTAELLTPELHAELATLGAPEARRADRTPTPTVDESTRATPRPPSSADPKKTEKTN